jgi:hypothetical protein
MLATLWAGGTIVLQERRQSSGRWSGKADATVIMK